MLIPKALLWLHLIGLAFAAPRLSAQEPFPTPTTQPETFLFSDGGKTLYYSYRHGTIDPPDTVVFLIDGSGCLSMNYPDRFSSGLEGNFLLLAMNKRHVAHEGSKQRKCGRDFELANNPRQWFSDRMEFMTAQLARLERKPKNVVLLGLSEGASTAARIARSREDVTHLAIVGNGAWTLRTTLKHLFRGKANAPDVEAEWRKIASDVQSIDKFWLGHPYRWWFDVIDRDSTPDYLALSIPILVGFGELDASVPLESARDLEARFKEAGKSNMRLIVYPAASHTLYSPGRSYRPDFLRAISDMLR
jgi:pimeloyl-ACP methyl ester carboxylesterase